MSKIYKVDYTYILPVLFMEYLAISIARGILPKMIVDSFGGYSYIAVGVMETVKGLLAFVSSPLFGKLSDKIGRKYCLLVTVVGTTFPVGLMTFTNNMILYSIFLSISGFFSATFALTFAYISDCVEVKRRAPAYGLALATFGLSFTVGPAFGSYIAEEFGFQSIFILSLILTVINVVYIIFKLPETAHTMDISSVSYRQKLGVAMEYIPNSWSFMETFQLFRVDAFMADLALIVFIYYTSVWAIVSTLMVYITRHLEFTPVQLGWLLSSYGLATMFSEGVLVRIVVPRLGETNSMRLGLVAFAIQCFIVALSSTPMGIFTSVFFSMGANLFYPSVSSLVSKICSEAQQGEALGALNGIKALTEGFGPLLFGVLMGLFELSPQPGAPFMLAGILSLWAFLHCFELPSELDMFKEQGIRSGAEDVQSLLRYDSTSSFEESEFEYSVDDKNSMAGSLT